MAYFDTSAWNDLVDHVESEAIVAALGSRAVIVFASVISAGEILKTPSADRRERLCSIMLKLHGDVALLERPMTLAAEAARAFFREERDFSLPRTGPGRSLLEFLNCPNTADTSSIAAWLQNLDRNHERFLKEIRPELPDPNTRYYSAELLHTEPFLKLLSTVPAAQELSLSVRRSRTSPSESMSGGLLQARWGTSSRNRHPIRRRRGRGEAGQAVRTCGRLSTSASPKHSSAVTNGCLKQRGKFPRRSATRGA
ncbi:MAG TPA: hypothetical protein VJT13_01935 [Xanthobacteraceae bacterium]|nr:hypothetical protein [Xanthobacteraceae bacterium]